MIAFVHEGPSTVSHNYEARVTIAPKGFQFVFVGSAGGPTMLEKCVLAMPDMRLRTHVLWKSQRPALWQWCSIGFAAYSIARLWFCKLAFQICSGVTTHVCACVVVCAFVGLCLQLTQLRGCILHATILNNTLYNPKSNLDLLGRILLRTPARFLPT